MPRWKGKTRGNRWGYMFFIALIKHFGTSTAYAFLYFVAGYFVIFARKPAKAIISYARKGLGYCSKITNPSCKCSTAKAAWYL